MGRPRLPMAITTLIVSVGRLGDLTGRRRLLVVGIVVFTGASILCGLAPTLPTLIAARALQGIGAAIMMALALAFVAEIVPKGRIGSAMGLLGTMSAIGTALGPSLGGLLIAGFGWRAIFLVNVPLGVAALFLAHRHLPADRRDTWFRTHPLRRPRHGPTGTDPGGLHAGCDDRRRQLRCAQHRLAACRGRGVGLFVFAETRTAHRWSG